MEYVVCTICIPNFKQKMAPPTIQKFESEEQVAIALAIYIFHLSAKFIAENGSFSVVLSGGSLIHTLR